MLLSLLAFDMDPDAWIPNQGMFTVNRRTNDEVDVTAAIGDNDPGPYVFDLPESDWKLAPEVIFMPTGTEFYDGQWYLSSLSGAGVGIGKKQVGGDTGGSMRLFIKRAR